VIRKAYESIFVRHDNVEYFSRVLDELKPTPETPQEKIVGVENDDDNGWTLLQLVAKRGFDEYVDTLLKCKLLIIYLQVKMSIF
jgi:hypothetical protein